MSDQYDPVRALAEVLAKERFRAISRSEWAKNAGMGWELRVVFDDRYGVRWWIQPGPDATTIPGLIAAACVDLMRHIEAALAPDGPDQGGV